MAAKLKVGDRVVVISGHDRGRRGCILSIGRRRERMVVEGVMTTKHHDKAGRSQQGDPTDGIETKETAIHILSVMYYEPAAAKAKLGNTTKKIPDTRVGIREEVVDRDGEEKTVRAHMSKATGKDP